MRRLALIAMLLTGSLAGAAPASADVFGSISLVSASPLQQADYAHDPAISGDGRYLVFDGSVGGVTGIWRREIAAPGNLVEVAGGDAQLPSISADGRYVSFTTNEGAGLPGITNGLPDPEHHTFEAPNVYVRDMSVKPEEEPAFKERAFAIASAPSGSSEPLSYENANPENPFAVEEYGAIAAGRSALSADGRHVVFVTTAVSNLLSTPEASAPSTPSLQVAVRDLDTNTTRLVTARLDPATGEPAINEATGGAEAVPTVGSGSSAYGAVYAPGGPPIFTSTGAYVLNQRIGASISADGSAVAWMAQNLAAQVKGLPDEVLQPEWAEPLWRRIADGSKAPIRRVTGASDPANPACVASGELTLPPVASLSDPCQGPFSTQETDNANGVGGVWTGDPGDDAVPQISGDGYSVAFLANAPLLAAGGNFGGEGAGRHSDLYVADMHPGLTRRQALRALTELASGDEQAISTNGPITDLGISSDGEQVSFTTQRTVFVLGSPTYVSAPAAVPGMNEVFDVDLVNDTLTRVSGGYEGGPSEHPYEKAQTGIEDPYFFHFGDDDGALSPSFSSAGTTLAFSSTASNLVFGDNNTPASLQRGSLDGADAFLVPRILFPAERVEQSISPAPPNPSTTPAWKLGATAASLRDGRVRLYLEVPGAGALRVQARGAVQIHATKASRGRRSPAKTLRTVASAAAVTAGESEGLTTVVLKLTRAYAPLASRRTGLSATATITFTAPGHAPLHRSLLVTFQNRVPKRSSR
jgi:hypothetical protein